jgi:hypothetical protein
VKGDDLPAEAPVKRAPRGGKPGPVKGQPGIWRWKNGCYSVRVFKGRTAEGVRERACLPEKYKLLSDAIAAKAAFLAARDKGVDLIPSKVTVAELLERYMRARRSLGRGLKTVERYEELANAYIIPHIGAMKISRLKPAHVGDLLATLSERGGKNGKALSLRTVKHVFALLKAALTWGVNLELAGRNVAKSVEAPTVPRQ